MLDDIFQNLHAATFSEEAGPDVERCFAISLSLKGIWTHSA